MRLTRWFIIRVQIREALLPQVGNATLFSRYSREKRHKPLSVTVFPYPGSQRNTFRWFAGKPNAALVTTVGLLGLVSTAAC